jgi:NADPH:quinone reductase-like Zn-dependent oxidoreductase
MRALALTAFGTAPEIIEIDRSEPAEGEVRVRVEAASVNGFDLAVASGYLEGMMEHRFPVVLGKDFAGTVDATGPGVSDYRVGDRVFGVVTKAYLGDGSFGEYVVVPTAVGLAPLPEDVDVVVGASLGLAGAAAVASVTAAELSPGTSVLVSGATGGVGNQVVQLAAKAGATVVATAATEAERTLVTELGAASVVDPADVVAATRALHPDGVDVVLHLAGDPAALLGAVRTGGRLVSTLIGSPEQLPTPDATVVGIFANPDRATLDEVLARRLDGTVQVRVQDTFPLDRAPAALAAFGAGTLGKIVVTTA